MPEYKIAKNLVPGDCILAQIEKTRPAEPATVLGVVESTQTVRRKVVIVTLRGKNGRDIHRMYGQLRTLQLVKEART